jgi:hypothetical protein
MKNLLLPLLLLAGLATSCAPTLKQAETFAAPVATVLRLDGADLIVPNLGGDFRPGWELSIDATPDYTTDAQGQAWCPVRVDLQSPKYGKFVRLTCTMPALVSKAQRRIVTTSGHVLASQGFAYRDATGAYPVPLTLP